ncbi:tenascin-r [Plakobranchus ocellatus]|uniref:Tenascin-r n=1 Tax=Plakobranchus ocellatus TaxID=259542 RepID=A0AAV3Y3F7_9GAST|nr:tenascin-r [Plakobranchus ocellatus]
MARTCFSEKDVMLLLTFFMAYFAPLKAFDLTFQQLTYGQYCATMKCTASLATMDATDFNNIQRIALTVKTVTGSDKEFFVLSRDGNGNLVVDPEDFTAVRKTARVADVEFDITANSIVLTGLVSDPVQCQTVSDNYLCYLELPGLTFQDATIITLDPPVDSPDVGGELDVASAVLNVMTTMADAVEKLNLLVDTRTSIVQARGEEIKAEIQNDTDQLISEFILSIDNIELEIDSATKNHTSQLQRLLDQINANLNKSTEALEQEMGKVLKDLSQELEEKKANLTASIENLDTNLNDKIGQSDRNLERRINELDASLQREFESLSKEMVQLGESTSNGVTNITGILQTEISETAAKTESNFKDVEKEFQENWKLLQESFDKEVQSTRENAETSMKATREEMTKSAETFDKLFDEQMNFLIQSILEASKSLSDSVKQTSDDLTAYLGNTENTIRKDVEKVQESVNASYDALSEQIADQGKLTEETFKNISASVSLVIDNSQTSLVTAGENSSQVIIKGITKVNEDVRNCEASLLVAADDLLENTISDVKSVNNSVNKQLTSFTNNVSSEVEELSDELTREIDTVQTVQLESLGVNFNSTKNQLVEVQADIIDNMRNLSTNLQEEIRKLEQSTNQELSALSTGVEANLASLSNLVDAISTETKKLIKNLTISAEKDVSAATESVSRKLDQLQDLTESLINEVTAETLTELQAINREVNASLSELEIKSMANLEDAETRTKKELEDLQGQSTGIGSKVDELGNEIGKEQTQITNLLQRYESLSKQLEGIIEQIGEVQKDITKYQETSKKKLDGVEGLVKTTGEKTSDLLSGVSDRIKDLTKMMETALDTFLVTVDDLGKQIETVGTAVADFVNTNIDEITIKMGENTKTITSYLQPKKCERNMNYASVSNNQYVMIVPNEENDVEFDILCDTASDGGGWIVIQRRERNDVSFFKNWAEYREGFGNMETDFYIGNERIHQLTTKAEYELRITVEKDEQEYIADFDTFSLKSEQDKYALQLGKYTGSAGDAFSYHNGMPFSTNDQDNDGSYRKNCATVGKSGWWFNDCRTADLNGEWGENMLWLQEPVSGVIFSSEMKIRLKEKTE